MDIPKIIVSSRLRLRNLSHPGSGRQKEKGRLDGERGVLLMARSPTGEGRRADIIGGEPMM
jgi:hypothetical protein